MQATSLRRKLVYGSGVVNYALKDAAFGVFVLFYYKQVLGLSGTLTGLAIALSVLWDAISDPLVGAVDQGPPRCWSCPESKTGISLPPAQLPLHL